MAGKTKVKEVKHWSDRLLAIDRALIRQGKIPGTFLLRSKTFEGPFWVAGAGEFNQPAISAFGNTPEEAVAALEARLRQRVPK